jgi:methanogenic corrinoid protein MtbC1
MTDETPALDPAGLAQFHELRSAAIDAVSARFFATHGSLYARFGQRGRDACREDLGFHLEFLRPVLEFGLVQPMVDYLRWLASVLVTRDVPAEQLAQSLDWLAEYFAGAMAGPEGRRVAGALFQIKTRYLEEDDSPPAIYARMPERWPECDAFEAALLAGDRRSAGAVVNRFMEEGRTLVDAEMHLIQPAMYGIGLKWQANQVSVAQEHLATAISQSVMVEGLLKSAIPPPNGRRVLLACVENNTHSMGVQMVADAFQLAGWDVQLLGANMPAAGLVQQVGLFKPHLVGLSVSFAQQLRHVKDIVARLAQLHGAARPPVIVGGLAINQFDRLAGQLGADAWSANAREALASASRLALQAAAR